jgi:hypothetical protein
LPPFEARVFQVRLNTPLRIVGSGQWIVGSG